MRPLRRLRGAALLPLLLLPFVSAAGTSEPSAYVTGFDRLYRLDLGTAQATAVGAIGFNDVEGLAFAPDGTLYGAADATQVGDSSGASDFLIRIDPATGAGTRVGLLGLGGQGPGGNLDYGLAFTCDGRLWLSSDTTGLLWEVTPSTGATRLVGNTGAAITGLAARGSELYGIGVGSQKNLYRIDVDTAVATLVGALGVPEQLSSGGADFDANGQLWATLDSQPPDVSRPSRLARVSLSTGAATIIGPITGVPDSVSVRGMAIAAPRCSAVADARTVPAVSPALLVLFAVLAAAFAAPLAGRARGA